MDQEDEEWMKNGSTRRMPHEGRLTAGGERLEMLFRN